MKPTTNDNLTDPGRDSFNQTQFNTAPVGACVYCGDYDPEFRKHFFDHYALNGGEYGRYSAAYELGHADKHQNEGGDWSSAEQRLRQQWERRAQGPWEDFKGAIQFGWSRAPRSK